MIRWFSVFCFCLLAGFGSMCALEAQTPWRALDTFEDLASWKPLPSEGVRLELGSTPGRQGQALRMHLDFRGGAGYAAMRRSLSMDLPGNYEIAFWLRGHCPPNHLEFKLVDPSGENVWWVRRPDFQFSSRWTRMVFKKRHVTFAWGPKGGGELSRIGALELAVTAGQGGKGTVDIEGLEFRELPLPDNELDLTQVGVSSSDSAPPLALGPTGALAWRTRQNESWLQLDFHKTREFGGLTLAWDPQHFPVEYDLLGSEDGQQWTLLRAIRQGGGGLRLLPLPEAEARFLRLRILRTHQGQGVALHRLKVEPLAFSTSPNAFFETLAKAAPRGDYPRAYLGEQTYWTVVGLDGGAETGLLSEEGAVEPGQGRCAIEPFLYESASPHGQGKLIRWSDVALRTSLEEGYLPMPSVTWTAGDLSLQITAFASGPPSAPVMRVRYRITQTGARPWKGALFLAVRPFQVNPPVQFLGTPGGVSSIHQLRFESQVLAVNGQPMLSCAPSPQAFGAKAFERGDLLDDLHQGNVPSQHSLEDPLGYGSGALRYDVALGPGATKDVFVDLPMKPGSTPERLVSGSLAWEADFKATAQSWREKLNRVAFQLPDASVANTLRTCLAHILISRNGPALQPGTRAYRRSWMRDGALMGTALLQLGHPEPVQAFLDWYAPYLFPSGKVPCVVDARGADPVPENDSHGQFIYLAAEYDRFMGDESLRHRLWPRVQQAWTYLDQLTAQRQTEAYREGSKRVFYGLVPESISHEGYAAKPMHSYWDNIFALRGFKDAAFLAQRTGHTELLPQYSAKVESFRRDLLASIARCREDHGIAYLPGCAELGDFDATSTTASLLPGGELDHLPRQAVEATFERFYRFFTKRLADPSAEKAYTPYETRIIGSMVQLGWTDRAHELLAFYMRDRRPLPWNQWPEVVFSHPRAQGFQGDLPHAWVGSDFIRSMVALFAFERETSRAWVLGAGLSEAWLRAPGGVAVKGLRLPGGQLDVRASAEDGRVCYELGGTLESPPGGFIVRWPLKGRCTRALLNGTPISLNAAQEVVVTRLPATVIMER
ncbi:MAG: discoidin domain-containing protein [Firmicutes bacterium]|nr:discoidin domain-containing protein [Bacillota bacterium]